MEDLHQASNIVIHSENERNDVTEVDKDPYRTTTGGTASLVIFYTDWNKSSFGKEYHADPPAYPLNAGGLQGK